MRRTYIKSSTLRSAAYNIDRKTLELEFISGELYQYFKVPHHHYIGLMKAVSHGAYFNQYIKDQYEFEKKT